MGNGVTLENANTVISRRPGLTFQLLPTATRCPAPSQALTAQAVGSQIMGPCLGQGIFQIHARAPRGASNGALAFFSMFHETPHGGPLLQALYGWDVDDASRIVVSLNGNTAAPGRSFMHAYYCSLPAGFDPAAVHKYTIHWSGVHMIWAVDGTTIMSITEPLIAATQSCVKPTVILRADGRPFGARTVFDVDEVAFTGLAAAPRDLLFGSSSSAFKCVKQ